MPADRPHVVVLMADQLRFDALGPHTPRINALLGESAVFPRGYCASPLCVPARGAFFTGRYPAQTGCLINPWAAADRHHGQVPAGTPNLYAAAANAGYDVWHTGKQHFHTADPSDRDPRSSVHWHSLEAGYRKHLEAHGVRSPGGAAFKALCPELVSNAHTRTRTYSIPTTGRYEPGFEHFSDGYIARTSVAAIRDRDPSQPFWLNAMFVAPHPPLEIPDPWYSQIGEADFDLPENVGVWSEGQSPLQLYNLTGYFGSRYSREQWREAWRVYLGLVALLDHCVGMILDELREAGMLDDTLVLFLADHGEMLGSHQLWQKMCGYEESIRTPIAFRPPTRWDWPAGDRRGLVSQVDVAPTLRDLLGLGLPADLPGVSLQRALQQPGASTGRERVFCQYDGNGALGMFTRTVVEEQWKLNVDRFREETYFELYDLQADPQEMRNLAMDDPARVAAMLDVLSGHMTDVGDHLRLVSDDYERFRTGQETLRRKK